MDFARRVIVILLFWLLAEMLTAAHTSAQWTGPYNFTTLDDPLAGPLGSYIRGMSGNVVVGTYRDNNSIFHGFKYDGSRFTTIDDPMAGPPIYGTLAFGISGDTIVGQYSRGGGNHGFIYDGSTYSTLDVPFASVEQTSPEAAFGSTVVGWYNEITGPTHGFIYNASTFTTLDNPNGSQWRIFPLGVWGQNIVGQYDDNLGTHGFLYDGSKFTSLDDPLASSLGTSAQGISGNIIFGDYFTTPNGASPVHSSGFIFDGSSYTSISYPGASTCAVEGISGSTIVGTYTDSNGTPHGFIATPAVPEPSAQWILISVLALPRRRVLPSK